MSKLSNAWVDIVNLTLSLKYDSESHLIIPLHDMDRCLSGRREISVEVVCGMPNYALRGVTNIDIFKNMKFYALEGQVELVIENENKNITRVSIDKFQVAKHDVLLHLHGHDPCRYEAKSTELCANECKPFCQLYATGYGMFMCGGELKRYNKDVGNEIELSHQPFHFTVQKLHMDNEATFICIQATTNVTSNCYAQYGDARLTFFSPMGKHSSKMKVSQFCQSVFFENYYAGSFCYHLKYITKNSSYTYLPKSLVLDQVKMYCDDFSLLETVAEIDLYGKETQISHSKPSHDICPHYELIKKKQPLHYGYREGYTKGEHTTRISPVKQEASMSVSDSMHILTKTKDSTVLKPGSSQVTDNTIDTDDRVDHTTENQARNHFQPVSVKQAKDEQDTFKASSQIHVYTSNTHRTISGKGVYEHMLNKAEAGRYSFSLHLFLISVSVIMINV